MGRKQIQVFRSVLVALLISIAVVSCGGGGGGGLRFQIPERKVGNFPDVEGNWSVFLQRGTSTCPREVENIIMASLLEDNPSTWIFTQPEGTEVNTVVINTMSEDGQVWRGGFANVRTILVERPDFGETDPSGVVLASQVRMRLELRSIDTFSGSLSFRLSITVFEPPTTIDCFVSVPLTGERIVS